MLTLLLCPSGGSLPDRLVTWVERGARTVHVALDLNTGWTVAAEGGVYERGGIVARPASYYGAGVGRWDLPLTPAQEAVVRAGITARIESWRYDWFQDVLDGWNAWSGRHWTNPLAARGRTANCSGVVAEVCASAGWWPFVGLPPAAAPAITPADWQRVASGLWVRAA